MTTSEHNVEWRLRLLVDYARTIIENSLDAIEDDIESNHEQDRTFSNEIDGDRMGPREWLEDVKREMTNTVTCDGCGKTHVGDQLFPMAPAEWLEIRQRLGADHDERFCSVACLSETLTTRIKS